MADRELVALVEGTPQLVAPTASDTGTLAGALAVAGAAATGDLTAIGTGTHILASTATTPVRMDHTDGATTWIELKNVTGDYFFGFSAGSFVLSPDTSLIDLVIDSSGDVALRVNLDITGGLLRKSATDSITAGTTQDQGGATALTTDINRITVCANLADVVGLPSAIAGSSCKIIHNGVQNAGVFPKVSGNSIDGGAANAVDANALVAGTTRVYDCVTDGVWETAS